MPYLFAFSGTHTLSRKDVTFLVIAENEEKAGWPIIAAIGADSINEFIPTTIRKICDLPNETPRVLGCVGDPDVVPSKLRL